MSGKITWYRWAKSQDEHDRLVSLGWRVAEQRRTHHSDYALLMVWSGEGEPA